jgi:hypothetical protein
MTWFPVQAALKMSTIPGAIRATLDALLDHINPAPNDPTRPDTLLVWESRERLAAEAGFSEVTIKDHLKRLRGEHDLRKGQQVTVLRCVEAATSHRAARYELLPAALDALVDPARLEAFEARTPRSAHPYHRWRQWRASQMAPGEVGVSALPQAEDDGSLGGSHLPQADAVGESSLSQLGQAPSPELSLVDLDTQELTTTTAPAAPFAHAPNKAETASPFWCPDCGVSIPSCVHRTRYREEVYHYAQTPPPSPSHGRGPRAVLRGGPPGHGSRRHVPAESRGRSPTDDGAVGSRLMANSHAVIQLGKQSAYLGESQEHRDYLDTVLRVLRAKLGSEPLWMVEFKKAALGQDPNACSQAQTHSLKDTVR